MPLEERKASAVHVKTTGDLNNSESWDLQFEWLLEKAEFFHKVFGKNIKKIVSSNKF